MFQGGIRAHGGQGATAGKIVQLTRIEAQLRGTTQTIRVWQGFDPAQEFTIDEARTLCRRADRALTGVSGCGAAYADLPFPEEAKVNCIILPRQWLIAFLAAMRRALNTFDTAQAMAPKPAPAPSCIDADRGSISKCIDDKSDPGSWERHLRDTAAFRDAVAADDRAAVP